MGMDGGFTAVPIQSIRDEWQRIKKDIENDMQVETVENIDSYSDDKLVELLASICTCCDTPCLLGIYVIFSYGDNVWDRFGDFEYIFDKCKDSISIETWT